MYKNYIVLIIGFLFGGINNGFSQEEISDDFMIFFSATKNQDIEGILNNMNPKLYDYVPKQTIAKSMEEFYADTTVNIQLVNNKIDSISNVIQIAEEDFAVVFYSFNMLMSFIEEEGEGDQSAEEEEDDYDVAEFTTEILKNVYGEDKVMYLKDEGHIKIDVITKAIAAKNSAAKKWTFVEYKENLLPILQKFIPEEVLKTAVTPAKKCIECFSLNDALVSPEEVESLIVNAQMHRENIEDLPADIGNFKNLKILYLTDHSFNSVPAEIGKLQKLEELSISGCNLTSLPEEIFSLKNLTEILLYDNQFNKKDIKKYTKRFKKELPNTTIEFE